MNTHARLEQIEKRIDALGSLDFAGLEEEVFYNSPDRWKWHALLETGLFGAAVTLYEAGNVKALCVLLATCNEWFFPDAPPMTAAQTNWTFEALRRELDNRQKRARTPAQRQGDRVMGCEALAWVAYFEAIADGAGRDRTDALYNAVLALAAGRGERSRADGAAQLKAQNDAFYTKRRGQP